MAQMHTTDAFLLTPTPPFAAGRTDGPFYAAPDDADLADDEDEEEEEDEDEDEDDEDEKDEEAGDDDDDDEEEEDEEDEETAEEARTAIGQLKRQNGHRWGGHTNG